MKWSELRDRWLKDPEIRKAYEAELPLQRLGARLAVRRCELRLSQTELAGRAEVTQRQVSAIENGKTNATIATLARIAGVLGLDVQLNDRPVARRTTTLANHPSGRRRSHRRRVGIRR